MSRGAIFCVPALVPQQGAQIVNATDSLQAQEAAPTDIQGCAFLCCVTAFRDIECQMATCETRWRARVRPVPSTPWTCTLDATSSVRGCPGMSWGALGCFGVS